MNCSSDKKNGGVGYLSSSSTSELRVSNTTFYSCQTQTHNMFSSSNPSVYYGGGVFYFSNQISTNLFECTFRSCKALRGGHSFLHW